MEQSPVSTSKIDSVGLVVQVPKRAAADYFAALLRPDFIIRDVDLHVCALLAWLESESKSTSHSPLVHRVEVLVPKKGIRFTRESRRILDEPNAGGSSAWSEAMSCEILAAVFGSRLIRTEMEIQYSPWSKITDYSACLYGRTIGVSVTRAVKHNGPLDVEDAVRLLRKKLVGVKESSRCVVPEHSWDRQILHVFAQNETVALVVQIAMSELSGEELGDTMVIISVCDDVQVPWLFYSEKTARLKREANALGQFWVKPQTTSTD
jgi:hypothetical protein